MAKFRYWRMRIVVMGVVSATLQGLAAPDGIEKHASPVLLTEAVINVAIILSVSRFGFSQLRVPKECRGLEGSQGDNLHSRGGCDE